MWSYCGGGRGGGGREKECFWLLLFKKGEKCNTMLAVMKNKTIDLAERYF